MATMTNAKRRAYVQRIKNRLEQALEIISDGVSCANEDCEEFLPDGGDSILEDELNTLIESVDSVLETL